MSFFDIIVGSLFFSFNACQGEVCYLNGVILQIIFLNF